MARILASAFFEVQAAGWPLTRRSSRVVGSLGATDESPEGDPPDDTGSDGDDDGPEDVDEDD